MPRKKLYEKRGRPPKHKPVRIIETGEVFKSYADAAARVGGNRGCVYLCLIGMRNRHHGYSFEYVEK